MWGISLASPIGFDLMIASQFALGSFLSCSAGNVIDDYWDWDIDKLKARTNSRPLTTGEVSGKEALILSGGLMLSCFSLYALTMPLKVPLILMLLTPAIIAYPTVKLYFPVPALILGLTYNSVIFMGYASITNSINFGVCFPLYLGGVFWTLIYDTIYRY